MYRWRIKTADLMHADEKAREALDEAVKQCNELRGRIDSGEKRLDEYRARWKAIDKEQFTGGTCPTCGQTLRRQRSGGSKAALETSKQDRKNGLLEDSKLLKQTSHPCRHACRRSRPRCPA